MEFQLIIDLLERFINNEKTINKNAFDNVDFPKLHFICEINHITPIVGKTLMEIGIVDNAIVSEAKMMSAKIEFSQRMKMKLISSVFAEIKQNDITYAVVKGIYLSSKVYHDIGIRFSTDIDLLISKSDVSRVKKIIKSHGYLQGYINEHNQLEEYKSETKFFYELNSHSLAPFRKIDKNNLCEIDVNFLYHKDKVCEIETNEFLKDLRYMKIYNIEFPNLDDTTAFLHLVLHHYRESTSLYYIHSNQDFDLLKACDIYYFVKTQKIDFDRFYSLVSKYNLAYQVGFLFSNINQIFHNFFDMVFIERINPFEKNNDFDEIKWPISLEERLQTENRFKFIQDTLSPQQKKSIADNLNFVV